MKSIKIKILIGNNNTNIDMIRIISNNHYAKLLFNYHSKHVLHHMLFYIYIQNLLMYLKFLKFITVLKLVILRQTKLTVHIAHRGYFSSMVIDIMISFIIKITSTILINSINLHYVVLISLHLAYTYLMQVLLRQNVLI